MSTLADRTIVALSVLGLLFFAVPDLRDWIDGRGPVEVACSAK